MLNLAFKPLSYIEITWANTDTSKHVFDWLIPWVISLVIVSLLFVVEILSSSPNQVNYHFFRSDAFGLLIGYAQTMPGFFIAALAAVATFNNPSLDKEMAGVAPKDEKGEEMSRRGYLSRALAYLTFLSIFLFIYGALIKYVYSFDAVSSADALACLLAYLATAFVFFTFFSQMLLVTFICLYYFGERMNQPN